MEHAALKKKNKLKKKGIIEGHPEAHAYLSLQIGGSFRARDGTESS